MTPSGAAHLYPFDFPQLPPPQVEVVDCGFVRGRQFGVDVNKFDKPFVFARHSEDAPWMLYAGPFACVAAARAWVLAL